MDTDGFRMACDTLCEVSDMLYQGNVGNAYGKLSAVLVNLEAIIGRIEDDNTKEELKGELANALDAMEHNDHILLADILRYEIVERISSVSGS